MDRFYHSGKVFIVQDGTPKIIKNNSSYFIEAKRIVSKEIPDENIWGDQPITLDIYVNKNGIGFEYVIPGGFSEYTYDPDKTNAFYYTNDLDWFIRSALDTEQRNMLATDDLVAIQNAFDGLQK